MDPTDDVNHTSTDANTFNENESESNKDVPDAIKTEELKSPVVDLNLYYDMSGEKYLIIFNHTNYKKTLFRRNPPSRRDGTECDEQRLKKLFKDLGFHIEVHPDLGHDQIIDQVVAVTKKDHKTTSCIVVVIMTHGEEKGAVHAADRPYDLGDIFKLFQNGDPSLVTTPKLFFIQACRGREFDEGRVVTDGQKAPYLLPTHMDFLILYCTVENFVSWRNYEGSYMIQELCNIIEEYSPTMDLLQMITLMNKRVASDRIATMKGDYRSYKQMPETRFTLTKFLKFS